VVAGLVLAGGAGIGGFVVALQITALAAFVYAVVTATMAWTAFRVVKGMFAAQDDAEKRVAKWPYIRP
jgi:hypothetical protein